MNQILALNKGLICHQTNKPKLYSNRPVGKLLVLDRNTWNHITVC